MFCLDLDLNFKVNDRAIVTKSPPAVEWHGAHGAVLIMQITPCRGPWGHSRHEKLDLLHIWSRSKAKSNMLITLTSSLTRAKGKSNMYQLCLHFCRSSNAKSKVWLSFDSTFDARQGRSQICNPLYYSFDVSKARSNKLKSLTSPLTSFKGDVKRANIFDFTFAVRQRWSQKGEAKHALFHF